MNEHETAFDTGYKDASSAMHDALESLYENGSPCPENTSYSEGFQTGLRSWELYGNNYCSDPDNRPYDFAIENLGELRKQAADEIDHQR